MKSKNIIFILPSILFALAIFSIPGLASPSSRLLESPAQTGTPTWIATALNSSVPGTQTPEIEISHTVALTDTQTYTPTPTNSPTPTATPLPTQFSYLPALLREYLIPTSTPLPTPETVLFCDTLHQPLPIPDNDKNGINDEISILDGRLLSGVRLYLDISHPYVGDLVVKLTNLNTSQVITTISRPGNPSGSCDHSDIITLLDDGASESVDDKCTIYPNAISGIYQPYQNLNIFTGQSAAATWRLNVSDRSINDMGELNHWCLETQLSEFMPAPTPSPTPVNLPPNARVSGMSGQDQLYKLDCETRSAVDWARHYGSSIDEIDFLHHLPASDDPEVGFVGDPNGTWGNIPPNDYGVHASPIASVLQSYGLQAIPHKSLSWDDLRAEIASGNPVIVWIIGDAYRNIVNGSPRMYIAASTGNPTVVARYEHTVIVVGYSDSIVTVLNGSRFMDISLSQFLDSWSVLDFMAVMSHP